MRVALATDDLTRRRGDYGFDEPRWLVLLFGLGAVGLVLALVACLTGDGAWGVLPLVFGFAFCASGAGYL